LQTDCTDESGNTLPAAFLWTDDDKVYDISPTSSNGSGWMITIYHDHRNDSNDKHAGPTVTVAFTGTSNALQIKSDKGAFDKVKANDHDENNRGHNWPDVVTKISVTGATAATGNLALPPGGWTPPHPRHPHYTVGICYH
jgi:hypothetical protein